MLQKQKSSIDSRFLASKSSNHPIDSTQSDIFEQKTWLEPQSSSIGDRVIKLPEPAVLGAGDKTVCHQMFQRNNSPGGLLNLRKPRPVDRSQKRQKAHIASLMEFGSNNQQERERLLKQKQEEEIRDFDDYEEKLKERLAMYPWINDEMRERKAECCERLHYDALRRLGLPLPEFSPVLQTSDLQHIPSTYQAI
jgi:ATP-dependent exoDNAse (exonuclease V) beta subunit